MTFGWVLLYSLIRVSITEFRLFAANTVTVVSSNTSPSAVLSALDALSASEEALDADVLSALELLLLEESVELENPHAAREGAIAAIRRMDTVFFFMIIDSSFCIFTYEAPDVHLFVFRFLLTGSE